MRTAQPKGNRGQRIAGNVIASYLRMGLGALVSLSITRASFQALSTHGPAGIEAQAAFGALSLVLAMSGVLSFVDQGGGPFISALAQRMGSSKLSLKRAFNNGWAVTAIGGVVRGLLLALAGPWIPAWVGLEGALALEAGHALQWLALGQFFEALTRPWCSVLLAQERFPLEYLRVFLAQLLRLGLCLAAPHWPGGTLVGLALAWIVPAILTQAATALLLARQDPRWRLSLAAVDREGMRALASQGSWASVNSAAGNLFERLDQVICTAFLGPSANGAYAVADQLRLQVANFSTVLHGVLLPTAARASAAGARSEQAKVLSRGTSLSLALCLGLAVPLSVFAGPFLSIWLGPGNELAAQALPWALAVQVLRLSKGTAWNTFVAMGQTRWHALAQAGEGLLNQSLSLFFVLGLAWGLKGIFAGSVLACLLRSWAQWRVLGRHLGVDAGDLARRSLFKPALGGLGLAGIFGLAFSLGLPASFFPLCIGLALLAYGAWTWSKVLVEEERKAIFTVLNARAVV